LIRRSRKSLRKPHGDLDGQRRLPLEPLFHRRQERRAVFLARAVDEELLELIQNHDQWPGVEPRRRFEHLGQALWKFVLVWRSKLFE
jgi:hypothetical protein